MRREPRILLVDGDILAYTTSAAYEQATEVEPGYWTWSCNQRDVEEAIETKIDFMRKTYEADRVILCLTDSEGNFRKGIYPTYKGNRSGVKKPLVLKAIREWLIREHKAYLRPGLEGDDCMGILATWPGLKGEKFIVSIDKDMRSIPGYYVKNVGDDPVVVSQDQADYFFLMQTLTGDVTDGYPGCPGIGPKKAEAILFGASPPWGTPQEAWAGVREAFEKAGLTEEDAIVQAQCARILRASDYDFKKKEPILWRPT